MKKIILALVLSLVASVSFATETKQVCHPAKDRSGKEIKNKDGSTKQNCKTIKVHRKVDGTQVPTTPPKK